MEKLKMEAELDEIEIETDAQKPSRPKSKSPGETSNGGKTKSISSPEKPRVQSLEDSRKFKLQLFPIDSETKNILVKKDHDPFLELTLSMDTKISSVVEHLTEKWMDSFSAISGGIVLYPYNAKPNTLVNVLRWTSNDTHTTVADVYEAIGAPSVFRLRYGFASNFETASNEKPLPPLEEKFHLKRTIIKYFIYFQVALFPILVKIYFDGSVANMDEAAQKNCMFLVVWFVVCILYFELFKPIFG